MVGLTQPSFGSFALSNDLASKDDFRFDFTIGYFL